MIAKEAETPKSTLMLIAVMCFLFTAILFLIVDSLFIKAFEIPSSSMVPTLLRGDQVLVSPLLYASGVRKPRRGDVVVFRRAEAIDTKGTKKLRHFVKRVVGLPGDLVEVRKDRIFLNGYATFEEEYINITPGKERKALSDFGPLNLKQGEYFVLGDNRSGSQDSRIYGPVRQSEIIGKAYIVYWSKKLRDGEPRWERVWKWIR